MGSGAALAVDAEVGGSEEDAGGLEAVGIVVGMVVGAGGLGIRARTALVGLAIIVVGPTVTPMVMLNRRLMVRRL